MGSPIQKAVNAIIRPPRSKYDPSNIPLTLKGDDDRMFVRLPLIVQNKRHQNMYGSLYFSPSMDPAKGGKCLIYLHGNASNQLEGQFLVPNFCPNDVFVFLFDFAGCGASDGDFVSLGYYEMIDTVYIINFLHKTFHLGPFAIWGRSMGAATCLLIDHPLVVVKVSDSSFTSVPDICVYIGQKMKLPSFFNTIVIWFLKNQVLSKAGFDFEEVSPISVKLNVPVPCVFGHSNDDEFIPFEHCERLFHAYPNELKFIVGLSGGHNGKRGLDWLNLPITIIFELFGTPKTNFKVSECHKLQGAQFHFNSFKSMLERDEKEVVFDAEAAVEALTSLEADVVDEESTDVETQEVEVLVKKNRRRKKKHRRRRVTKNALDICDTLIDEKLLDEKLSKFVIVKRSEETIVDEADENDEVPFRVDVPEQVYQMAMPACDEMKTNEE